MSACELALHTGRDAVLVNADIEFLEPGWLERMRARTDSEGRPAAVVGARLLYPNGLIQHAGNFMSLLHRDWLHRFRTAPATCPRRSCRRAARSPPRCSSSATRRSSSVGLYDEGYKMCFEDLDYCLRVFEAGLECIYEPTVVASHREKFFRGKAEPEDRQVDARVDGAHARPLGHDRPVAVGPGGPVMSPAQDAVPVGRGSNAVAWYRCALPALALDCDWAVLRPTRAAAHDAACGAAPSGR